MAFYGDDSDTSYDNNISNDAPTDWSNQYQDQYQDPTSNQGVTQTPQTPDWSGANQQNQNYTLGGGFDLPSNTNWNQMQQFGANQGQGQMGSFVNENPWGSTGNDFYSPNAGQSDSGGWDWQQMLNKGMGGLGSIFGGQQQGQGSGGSTNQTLKNLMGLYAASQEKKSNQQMSSGLQNNVQQQRQFASPFDTASAGGSQMGGTSMRDAMQQKLASAMQDPYGQKIVSDQVNQIGRAQALKDAAAGRRSNMATSSPAMLAAQAQVAQKYQDSLMQPAGANINPYSGGLEQLANATRYGAQGNSPYMSALGYGANANQYNSNPDIQKMIADYKSKNPGAFA